MGNSGMKSDDRENVFHHANSIISHSNQKEVNNGIKIEESNKTNGNVSASREIMEKLRQKYPSKDSEYIESNAMCSIKDNNDDDDLLLYCEGDEAEKNKDRLLSFKAGSSTRSLSPASFMQTMTPPNTMIDSCLSGREEPIKQTLLKALNGLKD